MTEQELQNVKRNAEIMATQALLIALLKAVARTSRTGPQFLLDLENNLRDHSRTMVVPGVGAAYSDLLAGEFQSAIDDLAKLINK